MAIDWTNFSLGIWDTWVSERALIGRHLFHIWYSTISTKTDQIEVELAYLWWQVSVKSYHHIKMHRLEIDRTRRVLLLGQVNGGLVTCDFKLRQSIPCNEPLNDIGKDKAADQEGQTWSSWWSDWRFALQVKSNLLGVHIVEGDLTYRIAPFSFLIFLSSVILRDDSSFAHLFYLLLI